MILGHARTRSDVSVEHIDIAPHGRPIHRTGRLLRVVHGVPQLLGSVRALGRSLLGERPDVVHLTTSGQLALVRDAAMLLLCRSLHVPVVYHVRFGRLPHVLERPSIEGALFRLVARHASCILTLDASTEIAVAGALPGRRVERLPNPVDFAGLPERGSGQDGSRVALFVGWVIPTKGVRELVQAWCALRPAGWSLVVAGPGDDAFIAELDLHATREGADVRFIGAVPHDEALEMMASCDVVVLPSHTEGFPNVVAEAMALGQCVVASDVGATGEMLGGGRGVLCPPKDPVALQAALGEVLCAPELRASLGRAAHEWAAATLGLGSVFSAYVHLWRVSAGDEAER
ncbi:MAG: WfgR [Actinotalea sp.]|nr:WfgR [Actinotalea sp.]